MCEEYLGVLLLFVCFSSNEVFMACDHLEVMFIVIPRFPSLTPQDPKLFYHLRQSGLWILRVSSADNPFPCLLPCIFSPRPLSTFALKLQSFQNLGKTLQRKNKPSDSWNSASSPPLQLLCMPVPLGFIKKESSKPFPVQNITLHAVPSSLTRNPILLL